MSTAYYNLIAQEYKTSKQLPFRTYIESHTLFQVLDDLRGQYVLDLACGEGFYTRKLKAAGAHRVVGVDISESMVELAEANERCQPLGCRYLVSDAAELPALNAYDHVVAMYLLNYAQTKEELFAFCRSAFDQLKSGGFFTGFNDNPFNAVCEYMRYRKYGFTKRADLDRQEGDPVHYTFYNQDGTVFSFDNYYWHPSTYREAFEAAGFVDFQWVEPELHLSQINDPHWEQFMAHPPVIGFRAEKP